MAKLTRKEKMAIDKVLQHLSNVCHEQLVSVILYGSKARGDFTPESDIDLLVLVRNRQNVSRDKIYDFLLDDEIDSSLNFSLNIYEAAEFQRLASDYNDFYVVGREDAGDSIENAKRFISSIGVFLKSRGFIDR